MIGLIIVSFLLISIIYIAGQVLSFFLKDYPDENISSYFLKIFSGLLFVITIFALVLTNGKSVFITLLPIYFILFYRNATFKWVVIKANINTWKRSCLKTSTFILFSLALMSLFMLFQFYRFDFFNTDYKYLLFGTDSAYYMTIAGHLEISRLEHTYGFLNVLQPELANGYIPYHYFDLWIIAFIDKIASLYSYSSSDIFSYVFFPFILSLLPIAGISVFNVYAKKYSAFAFIVSGLTSFIYVTLANHTLFQTSEAFSPLMTVKGMLFFVLLSMALILYQKNKWTEFSLILLGSTVVNILIVPAILLTTGILNLIYYLRKKEKKYLALMGFILFFSGLVLVHIFLFGDINSLGSNNDFDLSNNISSISLLLQSLKINIVSMLVNTIIYLVPLILIIVAYSGGKALQELRNSKLLLCFLFIFVLLSSGIFSYSLIFDKENAAQIYRIVKSAFIPFSFLFLLILIVNSSGNKLVYYLGITFILSNIIFSIVTGFRFDFNKKGDKVSKSFISEIKTRMHNKNPIGLFYYAPGYTKGLSPYYSSYGNVLKEFHISYWGIPVKEIQISELKQSYGKANPFYSYWIKKNTLAYPLFFEEALSDYILSAKIDFLITTKSLDVQTSISKRFSYKSSDPSSGFVVYYN